MFPVSLSVIAVSLTVGLAVGLISGLLGCWFLGTDRRWILLDALLGLSGEFVGLVAIGLVFRDAPWPAGLIGALLVAAPVPFCFEGFRARTSGNKSGR